MWVGGFAGGFRGGSFTTLLNSVLWHLTHLAGGWPCVLSGAALAVDIVGVAGLAVVV